MKAGDTVAGWTLVQELGTGGNARVWEAHRGDEVAAVKVPRSQKPGREPFQRFVQEVELLVRLSDRPGVLDVLDYNLDTDAGPAFHATPIGETLETWLRSDPTFDEVLEALSTIARELAELAREGVYHRDVKPSNLLRVSDRWVVGDLGLATYPEKEALTATGRKLGPVHYLAPEMLNAPTKADPAAADVYSMAKTAWVSLTGQRFPLPGQHGLDHPAVQIGTYVSHPATPVVDRSLARATSLDPNARPSMSELADELAVATKPTPDMRTSFGDVAKLKSQLGALTAETEERRLERERLAAELRDEAKELAGWLDPALEFFQTVVPYDVGRSYGQSHAHRDAGATPALGKMHTHQIAFTAPLPSGLQVIVEVVLTVQPLRNARHELVLRGAMNNQGVVKELFDWSGMIVSRSAASSRVQAEMSEMLAQGARLLLDELRQVLESERAR